MSGNEGAKEYFALNCALSTLSERCKFLQEKLNCVEEENISLRQQLCQSHQGRNSIESDEEGDVTTKEAMKSEIQELTQHKLQLSERIAMVAAENKQLWSRLSQLTKDGVASEQSPTSQNLIRSKTFTQNAPNPKLREKLAREDPEDIIVDVSKLALSATGRDFVVTEDLKKLTEEIGDIKMEVSKQQAVLKAALSSLKGKLKCTRLAKKAESENPVVEDFSPTDNRFVDVLLPSETLPRSVHSRQIDFLEAKRQADARDKMCPMCGKIYKSDCIFDEFQEHVEAHFIDDSETDLGSIDRFELISHTVGNF